MLTSLSRRVDLRVAKAGDARAPLLVPLRPVHAGALVLAVPTSRPRARLLRRVLAALGAVVLEGRVASASGAGCQVGRGKGNGRARRRFYGMESAHQRPRRGERV